MKVLYNDGQAFEPDDFNLQQALVLRYLFDSIAMNVGGADQVRWGGTTGRQTEELRPLRHAGVFHGSSGTEIEINGGLWMHVDFGGTPDADGPIATVANRDDDTITLTGFAAAAAGMYRRDIIQARIVENTTNESRDFEDAATRALSTQSFDVRTDFAVEYERKAGSVEYATQADADDTANEEAADSGWFKIGSVLVDENGITDDVDMWDWRKPWGYSEGLTLAEDFWDIYTNVSQISLTGGEPWYREYVSGANVIRASCPLRKVESGCSSQANAAAFRFESIEVNADYVAGPGAANANLWSIPILPGTNESWSSTGVGDRIGTSAEAHLLVGAAGDKPAWSNGRSTAYGSDRSCHVQLPIDTGDHLYGVRWRAWGGF